MQDPLLGKRLANYRIDRLIGRGGMASVYYGWDAKLRRPVAIKVTDASHQDIAYAKRLVHEARMIARWRHDHVIQVYYADQSQSLYFFAMEYIDGLDLGALMDRYHQAGEILPHADVVRIGRAIASALDYAHQRGVIHRDVKPSNTLLALDGRIILSDFGLALEVQQGTMGEVLGTPHYIAPEQARDSASTVPQSDLYALGVILYEMLTGSVPFDDPSPMSLALKHIAEQPPLPTSINPRLGIPVEAVLLKALSKAPEDRYQSGEVMLDALERALALSPADQVDERFGSPVADVLAGIASTRGTLPRETEETSQTVTAPVRHAREKSAKRRRSQLLILGAIGLGVLAVIALAAVVLNGLAWVAGNNSATQTVIPVTSTPALGEVTSAPLVTTTAAQPGDNPTIPASTEVVAVSPTTAPQQATPTAAPQGYHLSMMYTEKGFYLFNPGDHAVEPGGLSFEALDMGTGSPAGFFFTAQTWLAAAGFYPKLEAGKCDVIEINRTSAFTTRPADCTDFNAQVTPEGSSPELFWLARPNVSQFRVLWDSVEIARCDVLSGPSGACELFLPGQ